MSDTATKNSDELLSLAVYCRDRVNPYMFVYALSVVMIHRPDTRNLTLPSHAETFPKLYMDSKIFSRAREESTVVQPGSRVSTSFLKGLHATPYLSSKTGHSSSNRTLRHLLRVSFEKTVLVFLAKVRSKHI